MADCIALMHTTAAAAEVEQPTRPARIVIDELALDIVVEPLELDGRALRLRRDLSVSLRPAQRAPCWACACACVCACGAARAGRHLLALAQRVLARARGSLGVRVVVAFGALDLVEVHRGRGQAALCQDAHHVGVQPLETRRLPEPQQRRGRDNQQLPGLAPPACRVPSTHAPRDLNRVDFWSLRVAQTRVRSRRSPRRARTDVGRLPGAMPVKTGLGRIPGNSLRAAGSRCSAVALATPACDGDNPANGAAADTSRRQGPGGSAQAAQELAVAHDRQQALPVRGTLPRPPLSVYGPGRCQGERRAPLPSSPPCMLARACLRDAGMPTARSRGSWLPERPVPSLRRWRRRRTRSTLTRCWRASRRPVS